MTTSVTMTTPLLLACNIRDVHVACQTIAILVEHGADVNTVVGDSTPLSYCILRGRDEKILILLLESGANVDGWNGSFPPLFAAIDSHHARENVKFVLGYNPRIDILYKNETALFRAFKRQWTYIFEQLLDSGADSNIKDGNGNTLLMNSYEYYRRPEKICCLLDIASININETNNKGESILDMAFERKDISTIRLLIEHGANYNKRDKDGKTFLMRACEKNDWKLVGILASCEDLSPTDNDGKNAFMYACIYSDLWRITLLSDKYPDIKVRDNNGKSAMDYAIKRGNLGIIEYLQEKYGEIVWPCPMSPRMTTVTVNKIDNPTRKNIN